MMSSVGSSLKQLQELEAEVRKKQEAVFESRIDVERTRTTLESRQADLENMRKEAQRVRDEVATERKAAEVARENAEAARVTAEAARVSAETARRETADALVAKSAAQTSVQELTSKLEREKAEFVLASRQLEDTKRQVEDKRSDLRQAVARLADVSGLVTELAQLSDNPPKETIAELRRKARAVLPGVDEFLRLYRDQPDRRRDLDHSPLVGAKLSELKESIKNMPGFHWFATYSRFSREINIIALPDDQKGKGFIGSSIIFKLSSLPEEKEKAFLARPQTILEDGVLDGNSAVSNVELSSGIVFRCVETERFLTARTMRTSNRTSGWGAGDKPVGDDIPLTEAIGLVFSSGGAGYLLKGDMWPLKIHSPIDALKLVPETIKIRTTANPHFSTHVCLRFAEHRDMLSRIEIKISGLSEPENELLDRELTKLYQRIFHPKQEFLDRPDFYPDQAAGTPTIGRLGAFLSGIAQVALLNHSQGAASDVSIIASRVESVVTLEIEKPNNAPESIRKIDPLRIELTPTGIKFMPSVASN